MDLIGSVGRVTKELTLADELSIQGTAAALRDLRHGWN